MTAGRTSAESVSQDWCTPPVYVAAIQEFFSGSVALDPCSNLHSIVHANVEYSLPRIDGLKESWESSHSFRQSPLRQGQ